MVYRLFFILVLTINVYDVSCHVHELSLNEEVLALLRVYPTDGSYGYENSLEKKDDGTTKDLVYDGTLIAKGNKEHKSHCCGLVFEVLFDAFLKKGCLVNNSPLIPGFTAVMMQEVRRACYGDSLSGDRRRLIHYALISHHLGKNVLPDEALPGDFVQFWRTKGNGHSVIFIAWVYDEYKNRVGLCYWSTQTKTNGIGYNVEPLSKVHGIDPDQLYIVRALMPEKEHALQR